MHLLNIESTSGIISSVNVFYVKLKIQEKVSSCKKKSSRCWSIPYNPCLSNWTI